MGRSCVSGVCQCDAPLMSCATGGGGGTVCSDTQTDPRHCGNCTTRCGFGEACVAGACQVNTVTDPANCGTAGHMCRADQYCSASSCICRPGLTEVAGACVDFASDPMHCGSATNVCSGTTPVCRAGTCVGTGMCGGGGGLRTCGSACVSFQTDPFNCGGCGNTCALDEVCDGGNCQPYLGTSCTTCPCAACTTFMGGSPCQTYGTGVICIGG
jgi:hypothetical protein